MQIELDDDVSIPCDVVRIVKAKKKMPTIPTAMRACVQAYQDAYKLVYGLTPEVKYKDGYLRIKGQDAGVTKPRLREMTTQLKWRAG